jgi:hypothetical protein
MSKEKSTAVAVFMPAPMPAREPGISWQEKLEYCRELANASLLPEAYRKNSGNVLLAFEYGRAIGVPPIIAIQQVHIIKGKPVAFAALKAALVRAAGHKLFVTGQETAEGCFATATISRCDGYTEPFASTWSTKRADRAGLLGKDTWRQFPLQMCKARAISEVCNDACSELLCGMIAQEELDDEGPDLAPRFAQTPDPGSAPKLGPAAQRDAERKALRAVTADLPPVDPIAAARGEEIQEAEVVEEAAPVARIQLDAVSPTQPAPVATGRHLASVPASIATGTAGSSASGSASEADHVISPVQRLLAAAAPVEKLSGAELKRAVQARAAEWHAKSGDKYPAAVATATLEQLEACVNAYDELSFANAAAEA